MKKALPFLLVASLFVLATSCSKNKSTQNAWTFKGVSYPVNSSSPTLPDQDMQYDAVSPNGILSFGFANTPVSGTYALVGGGYGNTGNQVGVTMGIAGVGYVASGGNGTQTLSVSISSAGKVSITLPAAGVMMVNGADSAVITGTVTQP